jgi:hypothetical protein
MAIEPIDFDVRAVLTGKSPLVMHHPRTSDPDDEMTQAIKEITDKKTQMTAEDRKRKDGLQWRAGLYTEWVKEDGAEDPVERVIIPVIWIMAALEAGGKTLGQGTKSKGAAVLRSVTPTEVFVMLDYEGPQDIAGLAADPRFRWRTIVNPNPTARTPVKAPSVRPIFPAWSLTVTFNVVTDMGLGWDDFEKAFRAAGNIGIGDARKLGRGRFRARLTKLR